MGQVLNLSNYQKVSNAIQHDPSALDRCIEQLNRAVKLVDRHACDLLKLVEQLSVCISLLESLVELIPEATVEGINDMLNDARLRLRITKSIILKITF